MTEEVRPKIWVTRMKDGWWSVWFANEKPHYVFDSKGDYWTGPGERMSSFLSDNRRPACPEQCLTNGLQLEGGPHSIREFELVPMRI